MKKERLQDYCFVLRREEIHKHRLRRGEGGGTGKEEWVGKGVQQITTYLEEWRLLGC
jgi:hypothetical protein